MFACPAFTVGPSIRGLSDFPCDVAEFMHQTGLLQQFSFAFIREEEEGTAPELSTLREGLELEAKDDI